MKIKTENSTKRKTELLCGFVLEDSNKVLGLPKVDTKTSFVINQSLKDMGGKMGKLTIIPVPSKKQAQRILLAGIGKKENITQDTIRFVSGKIAQKARELKLKEFSIIVPPTFVMDSISSVSQIIEGTKMSLYKFDKFKTEKVDKSPDITIIVSKSNKISKAIKVAEAVAEGAIFTKSIANLPPNECTPATLANFAKDISKKNKMKCSVISLKPGQSMDEMKFDKCGGCTVLGIMKSVSELKLPINVVGIIPSVENMPGGEAYRPGDIIKLYNGKTAEILNTDAEGRLILADALAYGEKQYSPKAIIDFATLTGACIVALGNNVAAIVSNNEQLTKKIIDSSKTTTEQIWELPLTQDYMDMIKSDVADIKNVGIGRAAGTITAAAFLKSAIKDTPWAHLDIAGVAWTQGAATKEKPYNPKGATGFGVRLVLDYLQKL